MVMANQGVWRRRWTVSALLGALLCAAQPSWSQASPVPPTDVIPAGTPVIITLGERLKSGEATVGEKITFEVAERVLVGQTVVIPVGTPAYGEVEGSRRSGAFGRPGTLRLRCDYILLPGGVQIPIQADATIDRSGRSAAGAAAVTGGLTGLAAGSAAYSGSDIQTNLFKSNTDRTTPTLVGVAAGVLTAALVSSLFHGGDVTLNPGQRLEVTVAPAAPVTHL